MPANNQGVGRGVSGVGTDTPDSTPDTRHSTPDTRWRQGASLPPAGVLTAEFALGSAPDLRELNDMLLDPRRAANCPNTWDLHIDDLLRLATEHRGSDLHLSEGLPPMMR